MIRGAGHILTTTTGRGRAVRMVAARAVAIGGLRQVTTSVSGPVSGNAERIRGTNLFKYIDVTPREPQQLVWLVPQYGVDYQIVSNTNWHIK